MSESAGFNGSSSEVQTGGGDAVTRVLEICNKRGLHARASAKFVQTVRGQEVVGGTSIMGLMMLGAGPGTTITVEATGRQANEVIEALAALVSGRFTERD